MDFSQIVNLRQRRLDSARRDVAKAKQRFIEAGEKVTQAQKAVDDFLESTKGLEIELLSALLNKAVTMEDILGVDETLRKTKQQAELLAEEVKKAKEALKQAGEASEAANVHKVQVEKKLNKSQEIKEHMDQIKAFDVMAAENAELDEFGDVMSFREGRD